MSFQQGKIRGIADVVFVLDTSGSMSNILEAVKANIDRFAAGVQSGQQSIDLRLGLVFHTMSGGTRNLVKSFPFTADVAEFRTNLAKAEITGDEFTLPAVDAALDLGWRPKGRRFVAVFTDEPVSGGHDASLQVSKVQELKEKMSALHVHGYFVAAPCPVYDDICNLAGFVRVKLGGSELATYDFANLLSAMGKTVSVMSESDAPVKLNPNIYGI